MTDKNDIIYADLDLEEGEGNLNQFEFKLLNISHISDEEVQKVQDEEEEEEEEEEDDVDNNDNENNEQCEQTEEGHKDIEAEGVSSSHNYHGVLQVMVPNEHRRFYEKVWLAKVFQKLSSFQGFR